MNWEDFLRASTDYKHNRIIVKQYFNQLGTIPPTFRLLLWSEMIPNQPKDLGYSADALFLNLSVKVRKTKVTELYNFLYGTFKYQLNQVENEPHTEGDEQDVQLLKQKFMNVCYYIIETFYGEAKVIKRFLMAELQHQDKQKQILVENFMNELIEGFFFDLQGVNNTPQNMVLQIMDNFFLFGLEFICLLIKAIIQDFDVIFQRQTQEMEEVIKKTSKPLAHVVQAQLDVITAEIYHLQIEDPHILERSIHNIQNVILNSGRKVQTQTSSMHSQSNQKSTSQPKLLKYSPSKSSTSLKQNKSLLKTPKTFKTKQDTLETTGNFNTRLSKNDPSPQKILKQPSRKASQPHEQYVSKVKEPQQPLQLQSNKQDEFNQDVQRLISKYGQNKMESHFSKNHNKQVVQLKQQVLELQKRAIDMGKVCQEMLHQIEHLNEKEN